MPGLCVSDIPEGAVMRFTFGSEVITGQVFVNYGGSLMIAPTTEEGRKDTRTMLIDGQAADRIEAVDEANEKLWKDNVERKAAEFKKNLERLK